MIGLEPGLRGQFDAAWTQLKEASTDNSVDGIDLASLIEPGGISPGGWIYCPV